MPRFLPHFVLALISLTLSLPLAAQRKKNPAPQPYVAPGYRLDEDKDGVPDGRDKCPKTPRGEKVTTFGCPIDTDFDGLYDYEDKCPTVPGPKANFGCPWGDKDNDGLTDNVDACPDKAGPAKFQGCPDTDGDGIEDRQDDCPTIPGVLEYRGCPPVKKDTDGDGVYDHEDLCVRTPGVRENKGCPEIKPEEKAALKRAFDNLLFETGKDIIKESSYPSLNELATVMKNNPQSLLVVQGHTDDVGTDEDNQSLSENRALAVKRYLADRGINEARISTYGFGESRPVASNDTDAGRKLNRRVEMNIKYE